MAGSGEASGLEEEVAQGVRIPVGAGFAGRIAAERQPVILAHVDHSNVFNPILLEKGIRSLVGVPLLVNGAVIGVLVAGLHELVDFMHRIAFDISGEFSLSTAIGVDPNRILIIPALGGLILGIGAMIMRRYRPS